MPSYFYSDPSGLRVLSELLSDESRSIRKIEVDFHLLYPQHELFKVGCSLCILIKQGSLTLGQRIAALSLLWDVFRLTEPPKRYQQGVGTENSLCNHNPFTAFLFEYLSSLLSSDPPAGPRFTCELKFLIHLLTSPVERESLLCTTAELQMPRYNSSWAAEVSLTHLRSVHNIEAYYSQETAWVEKELQQEDGTREVSRGPVLPLSETQESVPVSSPPAPAPAPALTAEHPLKARFVSALSTALTPAQQNSLVVAIKSKDPENVGFLSRVEFYPEQLKDLIDFNPNLAVECLVHLLPESTEIQHDITTGSENPDSEALHPYLQALVDVDLSLHSMEVVNRLTNLISLPRAFFATYCCSCITTCENIKDKYSASRLVRIVCVFIQSLIRNKIISAADKDLLVVIESFTIDFSKIKEASSLYRLLKEI